MERGSGFLGQAAEQQPLGATDRVVGDGAKLLGEYFDLAMS